MDESHTSIIDESNDNDSLEFHQRSLLKNLQMQSPFQVLREKSVEWKVNISSPEFARKLDQEDHLTSFRDQFCIPSKFQLPYVDTKTIRTDEKCIYMCGQSLGLKPKNVNDYINDVLDTWGTSGVHSHFHGRLPCAYADALPKQPMAKLVGAFDTEIAVMNGLTVNLHLLLSTFYRPTAQRHRIIIEEHAFSSDMYAVTSQITFHGYCPESSLLLMKPRPGECLIDEEDVIQMIKMQGDSVALILIPGVQYYTGQLFDIERLTAAAQSKGIIVGCDLAHAVGNVPLYLHEWNVDFAVWCTYKYLNSSAGGIACIFVHEKWTEDDAPSDFPMLRGWWGNASKSKFLMKDQFEPAKGADMFKLSNPSVLCCAALMASLDIFSQTSMEEIAMKQFLLTGYLEYLLRRNFTNTKTHHSNNNNSGLPTVEILTPSDARRRGSQLSIHFSIALANVQEELNKIGVVCDIRKPSVLRVAPAPLYNSYMDVYRFVNSLVDVCNDLSGRIVKKIDVDESLTGHHNILSNRLRLYSDVAQNRLKSIMNGNDNSVVDPCTSVTLTPPSSSNASTSASDSDSDSILESNTL